MKTSSRRKFIEDSFKVTVAVAVGGPIILDSASALAANQDHDAKANVDSPLKFVQAPLGFSYSALEPNIDALTM